MVEQIDVEQFASGIDVAGDLDVVGRGGRVAGWMVVHQDDSGAVEPDGLFVDLADAEQRRVERAHIEGLDLLDAVFGVEADDPEVLLVEVAHLDEHQLGGVGGRTNLEAVFEPGQNQAPAEFEGRFDADRADAPDAGELLELFDAQALQSEQAAGSTEGVLGVAQGSVVVTAVAIQERDQLGVAECGRPVHGQASAGMLDKRRFADLEWERERQTHDVPLSDDSVCVHTSTTV